MKLKLILICLLIASSLLFSMEKGKEILGEWNTEGGKSVVVITESNGEFHGKIESLKEPLTKNGKPKLDKNNPKKALQNRKIEGMLILTDFRYNQKKKRWEDGKIYNPEDGKTYSCYLELVSPNKLKVRGFVGLALIGKTQIWKRKK